VCEQPVESGPCRGNHTRWFYHEETGECQIFSYSGCHGNRNRFLTRVECEAACRHKRLTLQTTQMCKQPITAAVAVTSPLDEAAVTAVLNDTCAAVDSSANGENSIVPAFHARWAFDEKIRRCRPFYFAECGDGGGNSNNFATVQECEISCPSAFPPELEVAAKVLNIEEGKETVFQIRVEGNPFPNISWTHNSNKVELTGRFQLRADR
jgi:hypothetical protein